MKAAKSEKFPFLLTLFPLAVEIKVLGKILGGILILKFQAAHNHLNQLHRPHCLL
jgi:hypothetical protein